MSVFFLPSGRFFSIRDIFTMSESFEASLSSSSASKKSSAINSTLNLGALIKKFAAHISHDPQELYDKNILIVTYAELKQILHDVKDLLKKQPMLAEVDPPMKVSFA